ncbi:hypothetical protein BGY98DRAFT_1016044 [Russula aff. rugulosa BPL654]|nr:hypothetical protein BGY98DRAFT_1016044 [Russula aff. rugulosa BPL654]
MKIWKPRSTSSSEAEEPSRELMESQMLPETHRGVHDEVDGTLIREREHILQAFC